MGKKHANRAYGLCLPADKVDALTVQEITKAKAKPCNCSKQRWRIEKQRRKDWKRYAYFGDPV